jgi:hypothetical protein
MQSFKVCGQGQTWPDKAKGTTVKSFLHELHIQRWDDHRYYHHSRINQALHLVSATCFVIAYGLLLVDPAYAAILAWCVSMTTRQAGHFFFEPRGYDHINQASDAFKEDIKVGYNIRRKVVLMAAWAGLPIMLWLSPSLFGWIEPATTVHEYVRDVGKAWLALGVTGLLVRGPTHRAAKPRHGLGVGCQDRHRPVSRHRAVPQGTAAPAARRADRPDGARALVALSATHIRRRVWGVLAFRLWIANPAFL